ncbi:hypothetical protein BDM02DRAFT_3107338, partial [Thelephora ganbajun]
MHATGERVYGVSLASDSDPDGTMSIEDFEGEDDDVDITQSIDATSHLSRQPCHVIARLAHN